MQTKPPHPFKWNWIVFSWRVAQCTENVKQGTFRENFSNQNWMTHGIVSYGLKVEYKHSLKCYIEKQFFENSTTGFKPVTLKSLIKTTSAGRGHFELLVSPPRNIKENRKRAITFFRTTFLTPSKHSKDRTKKFVKKIKTFSKKSGPEKKLCLFEAKITKQKRKNSWFWT